MSLIGFDSAVSPAYIPQAPAAEKEDTRGSHSETLSTLLKCAIIGSMLVGAGHLLYKYFINEQTSRDFKPNLQLPVNLCTLPEYSSICEGNLGIPRLSMPQIIGSVKDHFLGNYTANGVSVYQTSLNARLLTPIQSEMNTDIVMGIIKDFKAGNYHPCVDEILVSAKDVDPVSGNPIFYVIDGHHRYAACSILNLPISVTAIKEKATAVLQYAKTFPGVFSIAL